MTPELVETKEGDALVGEQNASLEDIEKKINQLQEEESSPPETPQEERQASEEASPEPTPEPQAEEETPPEPEPIVEKEEDRITKADLIALLREKQQLQTLQPKKEESPPPLTNEQKLEALANDPDAFIESRVRPYKDQLQRLEEQRAWDTARLYNPDFRRLEKTVLKLQQIHPGAVKGKSPLETLEWYYLAAKGMEAQQKEQEAIGKEEKKKAVRLKEKQAASAVPKATSKVSSNTAKTPEQMSLKELEQEIAKLGG